jgi:hypothetical protein
MEEDVKRIIKTSNAQVTSVFHNKLDTILVVKTGTVKIFCCRLTHVPDVNLSLHVAQLELVRLGILTVASSIPNVITVAILELLKLIRLSDC